MKKKIKRFLSLGLVVTIISSLTGCNRDSDNNRINSNETIVLRILENDTAKSKGYLQELLDAFNEAYKDKGIQAVDANMEEYTDLAANGPYGYGPDVIYQANDKLMTYAEDKHIIPLTISDFDLYSHVPKEAWEAFKLTLDNNTYYCGIPVNIQEPMLFYREDRMPVDWETNWDKNGNQVADFFENWNDLYAYSKHLRDRDESPNKDSQYGFMASLNNLYLSSQFIFTYGAYVFGSNEDGSLNAEDIGFNANDTAYGLHALKQMAGLMNEGCIDDTITLNRYEKVANGSYFCSVSTPDTYTLFLEKLSLNYEKDGLTSEEAMEKAKENLKMVELPAYFPKDGDLAKDSSGMKEEDWIPTIVMGGINGYGISSYTKHREASILFVDFATSFDLIKTRTDMLGIAPVREDVAKVTGGVTDMIFSSLSQGRIYLMPSIKAVDQIWVPSQTILADLAKDAFRGAKGEPEKYRTKEELQTALEVMNQNIYDAIFTLSK